jgi:3-oxoacyl-[acyl-carrier-protein] synthase-3
VTQYDNIFLDAVGVRLGEREELDAAVRTGRYAAKEYEANALTAVRVSQLPAPDLAVAAAREALARSAVPAEAFQLVLHASTYYQGQDVWTPSSYIQHNTIGGSAPAIEVDQKSNGGLAQLALAAGYLSGCDDDAAVLLTTGERFCLPGFDRFRSESGTVMADGGTAAVLTRTPGFARVLSCELTSDSSLEEMYRGRSFHDAPTAGTTVLDLRGRKAAYMRRNLSELESISTRIASGVRDCIVSALEAAKTGIEDVRWFVMPNNGRTVHWWRLLAEMGVGSERTTWEFGRAVGHLGAGDQVAGIDHLLRTGQLQVGDRVVIAGSGYGFNWGAAVLDIVAIPRWATTAPTTADPDTRGAVA